jgi:hypothetical protein
MHILPVVLTCFPTVIHFYYRRYQLLSQGLTTILLIFLLHICSTCNIICPVLLSGVPVP